VDVNYTEQGSPAAASVGNSSSSFRRAAVPPSSGSNQFLDSGHRVGPQNVRLLLELIHC
jgi:hypothetical protein